MTISEDYSRLEYFFKREFNKFISSVSQWNSNYALSGENKYTGLFKNMQDVAQDNIERLQRYEFSFLDHELVFLILRKDKKIMIETYEKVLNKQDYPKIKLEKVETTDIIINKITDRDSFVSSFNGKESLRDILNDSTLWVNYADALINKLA